MTSSGPAVTFSVPSTSSKRKNANFSPSGDNFKSAAALKRPHIANGTKSKPTTSSLEQQYKAALKEMGKYKPKISPSPNIARHKQTTSNDNNTAPSGIAETIPDTSPAHQEVEQVILLDSPDYSLPRSRSQGDDNEWQLPKRTSPRRSSISTPPGCIMSNRFNTLNNHNSNDEEDITEPQPIHNIEVPPSQKSKRQRSPPIYCKANSIKNLISIISSAIDKNSFTIKVMSDSEFSVTAKDPSSFVMIKNTLTNNNIPFYSYSQNSEKSKLLLLKGINADFSANEILDEISELKIPDINITKLTRIKLSNKSNIPEHFLVQLTNDSVIKNLIAINVIACQAVKWDLFRKQKVFQCYKCQRVGHASKNCNLGYRCVKCLDNHLPGQCSRDKNHAPPPLTPPSCVNCKTTGHTANYRGCPYIKLAQEQTLDFKRNQQANLNAKFNCLSRSVNAAVTYANITRSAPNSIANPSLSYPPLQTEPPNISHAYSQNNFKSFARSRSLTSMLSNDRNSVYHENNNKLDNFLLNMKKEIVNTLCAELNTFKAQIEDISNKIKFIFQTLKLSWI